ncbi:MAG: cystathionine gamma-synthase [Actinomycetales bacterium]|nr:cystathionine gamma-synthase [Actinomycetales bacterium]
MDEHTPPAPDPSVRRDPEPSPGPSRRRGRHAGSGTRSTGWDGRGFATRAIHVGSEPDPATGAVVTPVYQVSTFKQDGVGEPRRGLGTGYEYSRTANPTRTALEDCLAALESPRAGGIGSVGARAFAFASGLAAEDCLLRASLAPGDHVVLPEDVYGGTHRLVSRVCASWGVAHSAVAAECDAVREAVVAGLTRLVWVETPSNPLLSVADIVALAEVAHEAGALLVVDNTFATPYLQRPLALGADVVVHSTTKYCGGHSDVVGGAVVVKDGVGVPWLDGVAGCSADLTERVGFVQNAAGAVAGPLDAWLVSRGLKTLEVRMERHCDNAERIAEFLAEHPRVVQVYYPGMPDHPGHEVATRQMRRFGGMVSFRVEGGEEVALAVCKATEIFALGESLGGVESLIEHPGRMTHASVAGSPLAVPDDLIRLSVGIEDVEDLLADLDRALS